MLLYRILISAYFGVVHIAALFLPKAKLWVQGRRDIMPYVRTQIKGQQVIWVHSSSLGEFEQGRPIIEELRRTHPSEKILLTFFSPSGYEVRKDYNAVDYVCYLPKDNPRAINAFLAEVKPQMVIFVKYDYWFVLLRELTRRSIPVFFVSATIQKGHFLTKWYSNSLRKILMKVTHFYVQDEPSRERLQKMGIADVSVVGDTRVDRVVSLAQNKKSFPKVANWAVGSKIFICGSTWQDDEEIITPSFQKMIDEGWKIIIAPHDVSDGNVIRLRKMLPDNTINIKILKSDSHDVRSVFAKANILLVDTIGDLNSLYQYGDLCYVGGGFTKSGIHNVLEPAVFGLPLIFGPNYRGFMEAKTLVAQKGAYTIGRWHNGKSQIARHACQLEFEQIIEKMSLEHIREEAKAKTKEYIFKNQGATAKIIETLYLYL